MNNNEKSPKKGFLKNKFFRAAFSYLVLPLSLTAAAGAVVTSQLLAPMTGRLFPTAEDYLKQRGIDPEIISELSDREIRVRSRNFSGITHAVFETPFTVPSLYTRRKILAAPYNAYATRGIRIDNLSLYNIFNRCMVMMPSEDISAKKFISIATGIPEDMIEDIPVTDTEMFMTIGFHEFRHCHTDNASIAPLTEGDADIGAIRASMKVFKNPEIFPMWLHFRAMALDDEHNTSLLLDHARRSLDIPSMELIHHANKEALILARVYLDTDSDRPHHIRYAEAFKMALEINGHTMSALAKRRAELYIEAAEYFAPTSMGITKPPAQPPAPTFSTPQLGS